MNRALVSRLACVAATMWASSVAANGRFPQTNQIVYDFAGGPDVTVRTTFGVLVSHDRGGTFHWICEQAVGYSGNQDPGIGLFSDGSIAVAAFEGLLLTHDGGCSWQKVGKGLENEFVIDVAIERGDPMRGVAVTSTGVPGGTFHVQVWSTTDGGKTWTPSGVALPPDLLAETIDIAPTDPQRLYVSGTFYDAGGTKKNGAVEVSGDFGASWTRSVIDLTSDQSIYIAGVDPTDANRVYARTRGSGKDGVDGGSVDRLLVSKDGGSSFQQAAAISGPMAGFALSPDGARVAIGSMAAGLLVAGRDDLSFTPVATKAVQCLAWSPDGLYLCGSDFADGYVIGRTGDEGKSFSALIPRLADVGGPLTTCAPGGPYDVQCGPVWPMLQEQYGIGTAGGAGGHAGASGTSAGGAATAGGAGGPSAATPASGGCGCRAASDGRASAFAVAAVAALFAASRRKRRDTARAPVRE